MYLLLIMNMLIFQDQSWHWGLLWGFFSYF